MAGGGFPRVAAELAQVAPTVPRDRACLAPEEKHGQPGDARASVFSIGALLYELEEIAVGGEPKEGIT